MHRLFPSLTILCHSTTRDFDDESYDRWPDKNRRPHDPPITDFILPVQSVRAWLLEIGLPDDPTKRIHGNISIVSSPFRACLETAALIAHELHIPVIKVHFGVADSVTTTRRSGYDRFTNCQYLSRGGMQQVISNINDLIEPLLDVGIEDINGEPATVEEDDHVPRMVTALEEIKSSLSSPDEHCIVVTHRDVIETAVSIFGGAKECITYDVMDCGFLCVAAVNGDSSWTFAKSRMHVVKR
eukprot:gene6545-13241_t